MLLKRVRMLAECTEFTVLKRRPCGIHSRLVLLRTRLDVLYVLFVVSLYGTCRRYGRHKASRSCSSFALHTIICIMSIASSFHMYHTKIPQLTTMRKEFHFCCILSLRLLQYIHSCFAVNGERKCHIFTI